jgi:16S rRNA (guanine527-N7)-methyltransferase
MVHLRDIEDFVDSYEGPVDCVTARAVTSLKVLIGYVAPLLNGRTQALLLKGQDVEAELTEAAKYWTIQPQLVPSRTPGHGVIVSLDKVGKV